MTVALLVIGGVLAWVLATPASWPGSLRSPRGYFINFAHAAGTPLPGQGGGATVYIRTNLPDGTLVVLTTGVDGGTGVEVGRFVQQGAVRVSVSNGHCFNALEPQSATFTIGIATAPDLNEVGAQAIDCPRSNGCPRPVQPTQVLSILGQHFEKLTGAHVSVVGKDRILQMTSKPYAWPKDTCAPVIPQTRMPECPPQQSIFALTTRQLEWYAGQLEGMANQWKPCMVWASASAGFRAAHPWPEFRDAFTAWIEAVSRLPRDNTFPTHTITASAQRVAFRDTTLPVQLDIVYVLGDVTVATATLVHTTTAYELTDLELSVPSA